MAIYFTHNQYLKTAEEDYEAADLLFGHKYYDQVVELSSIAMNKYLKSILESLHRNFTLIDFFSMKEKKELLARIKVDYPEFEITEAECDWMDMIYGKAICSDGIHTIMAKQTALDAINLITKLRKIAKQHDKQAVEEKRYSAMQRK